MKSLEFLSCLFKVSNKVSLEEGQVLDQNAYQSYVSRFPEKKDLEHFSQTVSILAISQWPRGLLLTKQLKKIDYDI